jgi:DMSO/TMAO reductase YedYZ heme-binding membrane subunit
MKHLIKDPMFARLVSWLQQIQRFLAPRQKTVIRWFLVVEIGMVLFGALVSYVVIIDPIRFAPLMSQAGGKLGQIAVLLFCLTLLPGIFNRLQWNTPLTAPVISLLTLFRRHVGILTFLTAAVHQLFNSIIPNFIYFGSILPTLPIPTFQLFGSLSWLILLPVWLTSNDTSQRLLGKKWKTLQRLTYIAIWFIFIHVSLQGKSLAIIIAITAILEVASWVVAKRRKSIEMRKAGDIL